MHVAKEQEKAKFKWARVLIRNFLKIGTKQNMIRKSNPILLNSSVPSRVNIDANAVFRPSLLDFTHASGDIASKCPTIVSYELVVTDHYIVTTNITIQSLTAYAIGRLSSAGSRSVS